MGTGASRRVASAGAAGQAGSRRPGERFAHVRTTDGPSGPLPRCGIRQPDPRCPRLRAAPRARTIGVMPLSSRTPARTRPAAARTALLAVVAAVSVVALLAAGVIALRIGGSGDRGHA